MTPDHPEANHPGADLGRADGDPHRVSDARREEGDRWDRLLGDLASHPVEEGWVTLDEAAAATGVSRSTLRSWYRAGRIPSQMVSGVHGPQRIVPLAAVVDQALSSPRSRRQLEHARTLQAEVDELRQRVERIERHLGLG